jgi:hypothetical protein
VVNKRVKKLTYFISSKNSFTSADSLVDTDNLFLSETSQTDAMLLTRNSIRSSFMVTSLSLSSHETQLNRYGTESNPKILHNASRRYLILITQHVMLMISLELYAVCNLQMAVSSQTEEGRLENNSK